MAQDVPPKSKTIDNKKDSNKYWICPECNEIFHLPFYFLVNSSILGPSKKNCCIMLF